MKSFIVGVIAFLMAVPASASCRSRVVVRKQIVVQQPVQYAQQVVAVVQQPVYYPVAYQAVAPVQVQAQVITPTYQRLEQHATGCCCCCCQGTQSPPSAGPQAPAEPPAAPQVPSPPAGAVDTPAVQAIITRSCVSCHSGATPKGGLDMTDVSTLTELQRYKVWGQAHAGTMPKGGDPIPDADAETLRKWAMGQ